MSNNLSCGLCKSAVTAWNPLMNAPAPGDGIISDVLQCLSESYGESGSLSRLPGENLNFLLNGHEGQKKVLKIVGDDMPPGVVQMEFQAIEHLISSRIGLNFPRFIKNRLDEIETRIIFRLNGPYRLHLMEYVDGIPLNHMSDISEKLAENIGKSLAKLTSGLQNFKHPAAHRSHIWSLADAGQHHDKIDRVDDPVRRDLLGWAFDYWASGAKPVLPRLPWQIIHGDANDENLLVRGSRTVGLLDFGDCCFNPTVCELAICLAYAMMDRSNPFDTAAALIDGFKQIRALSPVELDVLPPLICGRLAVTVSMCAERRRIDPAHPNWFVSEDSAWSLLQRMRELGPGLVERMRI